MRGAVGRQFAICAVAALVVAAAGSAAHAEDDFFATLFGGFQQSQRRAAPLVPLPFASEGDVTPALQREPRPRAVVSGSQAYCVRTCDGRYFPISATEGQSKAASCNSFCPASETRVVFGASIDSASTENGKSYSELPNAFKYRSEVVPGCTCNGKDQFGLAKIKIEDDRSVRKGDIVAGADGLVIAGHATDRRHGELNFSPASAAIRAKYERTPVVASE